MLKAVLTDLPVPFPILALALYIIYRFLEHTIQASVRQIHRDGNRSQFGQDVKPRIRNVITGALRRYVLGLMYLLSGADMIEREYLKARQDHKELYWTKADVEPGAWHSIRNTNPGKAAYDDDLGETHQGT